MEQIIKFYPAFDKRDPDPFKNYGIGSVDILFLLKGEKGAIQFRLTSGWMLPHVKEEFKNKPQISSLLYPMATDLGSHSPTPRYEDQTQITAKCEWLDGKPCYYDGSGLRAEHVLDILLNEGSEGVWKYLEQEYERLFESETPC